MDWEKAKNIIISIFLILNIFLLYNLVQEKWSPVVSKQQISAAENILKEKGIKLDTKLPTEAGTYYKLAFEGVAEFDMQKVFSKLLETNNIQTDKDSLLINGDKQISIENKYTFLYTNKSPQRNVNINNIKEVEKYIIKFLSETGIPSGNLVLDNINIQSDSVIVTYVQKKGRYKLLDNRVEAEVKKTGLSRLYCCLQKPSTSKQKKDDIMPAYKVLLKNMDNLDGKVISSIDLGYTKSEDVNEMTSFYQKLYWRIKINGEKEPELYDVSSGELKKVK